MVQARTVAHLALHILQLRCVHFTDEPTRLVESGYMTFQAFGIECLVDPTEGFIGAAMPGLTPHFMLIRVTGLAPLFRGVDPLLGVLVLAGFQRSEK